MRVPSTLSRSAILLTVASLLTCAVAFSSRSETTTEQQLRDRLERRNDDLIKALGLPPDAAIGILIETGDLAQTFEYYKRIQTIIKLDLMEETDGVPRLKDTNLTQFIEYLGFKGLRAIDIERLDSELLMPDSHHDFEELASKVDDKDFAAKRSLDDFDDGNVLVSRFFAPKIVNYNETNDVVGSENIHKPGWRKLVRLRALPGSKAAQAGMSHAYILFNVFEGDETKDPFLNDSGNNQVILVPKKIDSKPSKVAKDAAFWMLFVARKDGYKLGAALNVGFDLPLPPDFATKRDYFVPTACAQCHGHDAEAGYPLEFDAASGNFNEGSFSTGIYPFAKVNYLDTDLWYDAVEYDFPGTKKGPFDVVFDGEKDDYDSRKHERAFDVLRQLNKEIQIQNRASARPNNKDNFKLAALANWLDLHEDDDDAGPVPPENRALDLGTGVVWKKNRTADRAVLRILNRYCSRCHTSMYWNVFDKSYVVDPNRGRRQIKEKLERNQMPQGRKITDAEKTRILDYLKTVN